MPFSEATLDFMALNRVMNSREWFHEHRDEYLSLVVEPIAELVEDMAPEMWKIDPSLIIIPKVGKSISRIWRDTRRGPELPIYRDVMWITLLRAKYEGYPSFWFEFSPRCLRWGCGWYQTDPAIMDCIRGMILSHDPDWRAALAAFEAQKVFRLDDERYKRSRHPDAPENERAWLDQKSLCLTHEETKLDRLYSDKLAAALTRDFRRIAPVYEFFLKAVGLARLKDHVN
ncbi:MAG TPA: DUF2461 domain-containing protein [Candidatus Scatomorpha pullicola]|nr:DUF2461 domain-containing protein [Candidatus Scatomorpha pullicola]